MATLVAASGGQWITTTGSIATTYPTGIAAGDRVFLWFSSIATFTTPTGWTEIRRSTNATIARTTVLAWVDYDGSTAAPSIAITGKGAWNMIAFRRSSSSASWTMRADLDATDTTTGTTITPPAASGALAGDTSILFTAGRQVGTTATAVTTTPPASWTEPANGDQSTASGTTSALRQVFSSLSYRLSLTAGTVTPAAVTFSLSSAASATQVILGEDTYPQLSTLTDDFTTQDNVKWTGWNANIVANARSSLDITLPGSGVYPELTSTGNFRLVGSSAYVKIFSRPPVVADFSSEMYLKVYSLPSGNNSWLGLAWNDSAGVGGEHLYCREVVAGVVSDTQVAYDAVAMVYLRIREAAGTVFWETSPDGTTWTAQRSKANTVDWTNVVSSVNAGYWGTVTGAGTASWSSFNSIPPISGAAALSSVSSLTVDGVRTTAGAAALSSVSSLTVDGVRTTAGAVSLTSTDTLTVGATRAAAGAVSLTSTDTLTVGATRATAGAVSLVATDTVSMTAKLGAAGAVALVATDILTAAASVVIAGHVARGVNESGAEYNVKPDGVWGTFPGTYGSQWFYDAPASIAYLASRGINSTRLPIAWERIQPTRGAALNAAEQGRITSYLDTCQTNNIKVIICPASFCRYREGAYPTPGITLRLLGVDLVAADFTDFWTRMVAAFGSHPAVLGWELQNEPFSLPSTNLGSTFGATFDTTLSGWTTQNCTLVRTTTAPRTGAGALQMTVTSTTSGGTNAQAWFATGGASSLTFSVYVRSPAATGPAQFVIDWYDSSMTYLTSTGYGWINNVSTSWQQSTATFAPPAGAWRGQLSLDAFAASAGDVFIWDDLTSNALAVQTGAQLWEATAQTLVTAIRGTGDTHTIYVPGNEWQSPTNWRTQHPSPFITDPLSNFKYSAHHYFDKDQNASFAYTYTQENTDSIAAGYASITDRALSWLAQFTDWCDEFGVKGAITETGWPHNADAAAWNGVADALYVQLDLLKMDVWVWMVGESYGSANQIAPYDIGSGSILSRANAQAPIIEAHLTGSPTSMGTVAMTATDTLTVGGVVTRPAAVSMTSTDSLTVNGVTTRPAVVSMTAVDTLTANAVREQPAVVAEVATHTLTVNGISTRQAVASLSAVHTLTATSTGISVLQGVVAMTATDTVTVVAVRTTAGTVNMTAADTLTVNGVREQLASVSMTAFDVLTVAGTIIVSAAAALVETHSLVVTALLALAAAAAMVAVEALVSNGVVTRPASVSMAATSTLTADGTVSRAGAVAMTASDTVAANATVTSATNASVNMTAADALTSTGALTQQAIAALTGADTLTANGSALVTYQGAAAMTAVDILTTDGRREYPAFVSMTVTDTITAIGFVAASGTVSIASTDTLTANAITTAPVSAILTSTETLTISAFLTLPAVVSMSSADVLSAAGIREQFGVVAMVSTDTLIILGVREQLAIVAMTASSILSGAATLVEFTSVQLTSTETLTVNGIRTVLSSVPLVGVHTLTVDGSGATGGAASMVATHTLTSAATVIRILQGVVSMSSADTLTSDGIVTKAASVSMTASETLNVIAYATVFVTSTLVTAETLTVSGVRILIGVSDMTSVDTLTVSAIAVGATSVFMSATDTLTSAGRLVEVAAVAIVGTDTLTATAADIATYQGVVSMVETSTLTSDGIVTRPAIVAMVASEITTAAGQVSMVAVVSMVGADTLVTDGIRTVNATVNMVAIQTLLITGIIGATASVIMASADVLTINGVVAPAGSVALVAVETLTAAGQRVLLAAVAIVASEISTADGTGIPLISGVVAMTALGQLIIVGVVTRPALVLISSVHALLSDGTPVRVASAPLVGDSTLTTTATTIKIGLVALLASSSLGTTGTLTTRAIVAMISFHSLLAAVLGARVWVRHPFTGLLVQADVMVRNPVKGNVFEASEVMVRDPVTGVFVPVPNA